MTKQFTKNNFFENTKAHFNKCETPKTNPDYISGSGSTYWYTENGVIRNSNHWGGNIASCSWFLGEDKKAIVDSSVSAFCAWSDFKVSERAISSTYYQKLLEIEKGGIIDFYTGEEKKLNSCQKNLIYLYENYPHD